MAGRQVVRVKSAVVVGVEALPVDVEVTVSKGEQRFIIIGLGDAALREARDRVGVALQQLGFKPPPQVLVNLAPADQRKEGSGFDLPIAVAILAACGAVPRSSVEGKAFYGELALDGAVKPVRGLLSCMLEQRNSGPSCAVIPEGNSAEGQLVPQLEIRLGNSLGAIVRWLRGEGSLPLSRVVAGGSSRAAVPSPLLGEVWGQEAAKRALILAAAGGHNLLMIGPPGCGKSMLAQRILSILPPMSEREQIESAKIHAVAGLPLQEILAGRRPFRSPHHVVSEVGLIGGGLNPKPGEISLAHHGVLFLDEFPEFRRSALESLRAPMESGVVNIVRARARHAFPAQFQLVAAMNPCPCGRLGARAAKAQSCQCSRTAIDSYLRKLSQPILDRIDLQVEMDSVPLEKMIMRKTEPCSDDDIAASVRLARARQEQRQKKPNSLLSLVEIHELVGVEKEAHDLLFKAAGPLGITARGFVRLLRVAATAADLVGGGKIRASNMAEALSFRALSTIERYVRAERSGDFASGPRVNWGQND